MRRQTLVYIHDLVHRRVLFGRRQSSFANGFLTGYGGNLEKEDKSPAYGAAREVDEESGILVRPQHLDLRAVVDFTFQDGSETLRVYGFYTTRFLGFPQETAKMAPVWAPEHSIPYEQCMPSDRLWLPSLFADVKAHSTVLYNNPREFNILDYRSLETDLLQLLPKSS